MADKLKAIPTRILEWWNKYTSKALGYQGRKERPQRDPVPQRSHQPDQVRRRESHSADAV